MNEKALESFINMCDEMLVPTQEGFTGSLKVFFTNAANGLKKLVAIILEKIENFKVWIKSHATFTIDEINYKTVQTIGILVEREVGKQRPYLLCKEKFTDELKKEYENSFVEEYNRHISKLSAIKLRLGIVSSSNAGQIYKQCNDAMTTHRNTALVLNNMLGQLESSIQRMTGSSEATTKNGLNGPTADKSSVNSAVHLANNHIYLIRHMLECLNKVISLYRRCFGTSPKAVKPDDGKNVSLA